MVKPIIVGPRQIAVGMPCFVIAEAGVNHNGDLALARALIDVAADAGADAVKFRTFSAAALTSPAAAGAIYQNHDDDDNETQRALLQRLELDEAAHRKLIEHCNKRNIVFLSSSFDAASADLLEKLDVPAFKIPSSALTNLEFLAHVARKGRPMLVSTGMSTEAEVATATETIRATGNPPLVLLHCVSAYPARPEDSNLYCLLSLSAKFGVPTGWSDHTAGLEMAIVATTLGAAVIEKHLTLDRLLPGPDHMSSLEPEEFFRLVRLIRQTEAALGDGVKRPVEAERKIAAVARRLPEESPGSGRGRD